MRLLLADDQAPFREALSDLLSSAPGVEVVAAVSDGSQAVEAEERLRPDIVLMDIRMPVMDGIVATAAIRARRPNACIVVLTTFDDDRLIARALQAGATGYLLKGTPLEDMLSVFALALRGYVAIGRTERERQAFAAGEPTVAGNLTEREREVWALLGEGLTNRDIAQRLALTEGTVKNYVTAILCALGVRHRTQAALLWRKGCADQT